MEIKARIVAQKKHGKSYELGTKEIMIGRSNDCSICIPEKHVSRRHAKIIFEKNGHAIENIGTNPVIINGRLVEKHFLQNGDHLFLGNTEFVYYIEESKPDTAQEHGFEQKTVILNTTPFAKEQLPRLVLITPDGQSRKYDIKKKTFYIGRAIGSDIHIDDPIISRKHCVISISREGLFIENLSEANPVICQNRTITKKRLVSGDQFKIGAYLLSFFSDRPEDLRHGPDETDKSHTTHKGIHTGVWSAVACLLVVSAICAFYFLVYGPLIKGKPLKKISVYIEKGDYENAHRTLTRLIDKNSVKLKSQEDEKLLSWAVVSIAGSMVKEENYPAAKEFLKKYIDNYGQTNGPGEVLDLLDQCHLKLGRRLANYGKIKKAKLEFSEIKRQDSPYFNEAQQALNQLSQNKSSSHFERQSQQTTGRILEMVSVHIENNNYEKARNAITPLLDANSTQLGPQKDMELLTWNIISIGRSMLKEENFSDAIEFLGKYLNKYGQYDESGDVPELQDLCRLGSGRQLEDTGKYREAELEYSIIESNSPHFDEARMAIYRLQQVKDKSNSNLQTISRTLEEAGVHFKAYRYLSPPGKNAYDAYQSVLSRDPTNTIAIEGIENIKDVFRESGNSQFDKGDYANALDFYEKFLLIGPQNSFVKERIFECKQKLGMTSTREIDTAPQREEINKFIDGSDPESSWISDYLKKEEPQKNMRTP